MVSTDSSCCLEGQDIFYVTIVPARWCNSIQKLCCKARALDARVFKPNPVRELNKNQRKNNTKTTIIICYNFQTLFWKVPALDAILSMQILYEHRTKNPLKQKLKYFLKMAKSIMTFSGFHMYCKKKDKQLKDATNYWK